MIRVIALFLLFASCAFSDGLTADQIRTYLNSNSTHPLETVSATDARYPIVQILKSYKNDQQGDNAKTIATLESLLEKSQFQISNRSIESYGVWRDLAYLLLARAYYEKQDPTQSLAYLKGIQPDSPFSDLARAQSIWDFIELNKFEMAKPSLTSAKGSTSTKQLAAEFTLQKAVIEADEARYQRAIKEANSVRFDEPEFEDTRLQVLAESTFRLYLSQINLNFDESKSRLEQVLRYASAISPRHRDAKFAYFMADVEWHLASAYRTKNPITYAATADQHLSLADQWLAPWVHKSIQLKSPLLPEEAMFLSSIVLWEQQKYEAAIPRLLLTIQFYPRTQYKEDIYQLIGDYYFDHEKFHRAVESYRLLANSGDVEKAGYGIYKAAWAFYNLKQKFKALRHLERLVLFYQKYPAVKDTAGLQVESMNDMLFMLTELLPAQKTLNEFHIFDFTKTRRTQIESTAAEDYKKIGKFADSIYIYKTLLRTHSHDKQYYSWLETLLQTELDAGQRLAISQSLDEFLPPGSVAPESLKKTAVTLQLTIHREGNKTDDPAIWKATDALYASMSRHFPTLQSGDFWYFGAQRKEKLGRINQALTWYSKAALVNKYENAKDASLTILRMLNTMAAHDAVNDRTTPPVQNEIVQWSKWYIDHFGETPEIAVCDRLYLEALFNLHEYPTATARLLTVLSKHPTSKKEWQNYLYFNGELYRSGEWQIAFTLTQSMLSLPGISKDNKRLLRQFRAESAFQVAYKYDAAHSIANAQKWYRITIADATDTDVELKAWHNLIISFKADTADTAFDSDYNKFVRRHFSQLSRDQNHLCVEIHEFAADYLRDHARMDERFQALSRAADYLDPLDALPIRWAALSGFGAYYDQPNFFSELKKWQALHPHPTPENQVLLAKLYFWLGDAKDSWAELSPLLNKTAPEDTWPFVRDLYLISARKNQTDSPIVTWLNDHPEIAKSQPSLQGIWSRQIWQKLKTDLPELAENAKLQRQPDSDSLQKAKAGDNLATRLQKVTGILKSMTDNKKKLSALFVKGSPQIAVEGLCQLPTVTQQTISQLSALNLRPLAVAEWAGFSNRLEKKMSQLKLTEKQEQHNCENQKQRIAEYEPLNYPLTKCFRKICPEIRSVSAHQIEKMDTSGLSAMDALKQTERYATIGAWATAEYWADQLADPQEKALSLGYLRLVWRDPWTAYNLLEEAAKQPKFSTKAHQLIQEIAD